MTRQRDPRENPADAEQDAEPDADPARGTADGLPDGPVTAPLAEPLRAALRVGAEGAPGDARDPHEAAAVDAFRRARDAGEHRSRRTRRRDDWRPATVRSRGAAPVRAVGLGVAVTVLLGGVAVAAGTGVIPDLPDPGPGPSAPASRAPRPAEDQPAPRPEDTPDGRSAPGPGPSSGPGRERPDTAADEAAHCRTYLAAMTRKGKAPDGTAFRRLEAEAGGPERVAEHCAPVLGEQEREPRRKREKKEQ
ncbi:hypothetical protein ABZO31_20575 [Streptomyces sp. HUAS MG47]|uniref:hypothetical protein n=1 Tax=Streptomyces solicamelliae TaxID=3231716 RepID=UPI003877DF6A